MDFLKVDKVVKSRWTQNATQRLAAGIISFVWAEKEMQKSILPSSFTLVTSKGFLK